MNQPPKASGVITPRLPQFTPSSAAQSKPASIAPRPYQPFARAQTLQRSATPSAPPIYRPALGLPRRELQMKAVLRRCNMPPRSRLGQRRSFRCIGNSLVRSRRKGRMHPHLRRCTGQRVAPRWCSASPDRRVRWFSRRSCWADWF
jgi:hypothetical protein